MNARRRVLIAVASVAALFVLWLQTEPGDESTGVSGMSMRIGDRFVAVDIGREKGDVTFVVVRDWPMESTVAERMHDPRFDRAKGLLHSAAGDTIEVAGQRRMYFFRGDSLAVTPVRMREDRDLIGLRPEAITSLDQLEAYFKKFTPDETVPQE